MYKLSKSPKAVPIVNILSVFLFSTSMIVTFIFLFGTYTYKTDVYGYVVDPSVTKIISIQNGYVTSLIEKNADSLKLNAGDYIATINKNNTETYGNGILTNKRMVKELDKLILKSNEKLEIYIAKSKERIDKLNDIIENISHDINLSYNIYENLMIAKSKTDKILTSTLKLHNKGYVNFSEKSNKELELIQRSNDINDIMLAISNLETRKIDLSNQIINIETDMINMENQTAEQVFQYEQKKKEHKNIFSNIVTAPLDMDITDILISNGEEIMTGDVLAVGRLKEKNKPYLQFKVTQESIGYIDVGDKILIRMAAFPYDKFGVIQGEITNISESTNLDRNQRFTQSETKSFYYMNVDIIESKKIPLSLIKDGMKVSASIHLQKLTLIEWLFLPISKSLIRNPDF